MADTMREDEVRESLGRAIDLTATSLLRTTLVAGTLTGLETQAVAARLQTFAEVRLEHTRRLVEKQVALGGTPSLSVPEVAHEAEPEPALRGLLELTRELVAALHRVIPDTGQEPRSEALEHLLEHVIMQTQEQADYLARVLGTTA